MGRLVAGSIGSTDTVIGGNPGSRTTTNVCQTILGSGVLATHQSDSKHPSDGEVEGKVGLDRCDGPSDWTGRRISRLSTASSSVVNLRDVDIETVPSRPVIVLYFLIFRCLHVPYVGPSAEDVESRG